jgi:osomolarity two-component system response regulator SKN7
MMAYNSTPVRLAPVVTNPTNMGVGTIPPISNMPLNAQANLSPHTDAGSRNGDGPSPAASRTSGHRGSITQLVQEQAADEVIELPNTASSSSTNPNQTLYNGEPLEMTPMFADTSGWLPDGTPAPTGGIQRRSSDGSALRVVMEALNPASQAVRFEDGQDPLDPSAQDNAQDSSNQSAGMSTAPAITTDGAAVAAAAGANALVQQSPFGTLVIPNGNDAKPTPAVESNTIRLRRSTTIKPHWTQTPRILVVEDDVVYRQLSSKFLEKFGCITETVEDAQGAVEKMNATKYDLVLMDIFFGPSMDG